MTDSVAEKCVLDDRHKRLRADLAEVAAIANIPVQMIERSAKPFLSEAVLDWVRAYPTRRSNSEGLIITGVQSIAPDTQMCAIAGALIRNFIDARVLSLNTLIKLAEDGDQPQPTVMLCPNLFAIQPGRALPGWKIQLVYDLLIHRRAQNKLSVLYVESMAGLEEAYGSLFAQHLKTNYVQVK